MKSGDIEAACEAIVWVEQFADEVGLEGEPTEIIERMKDVRAATAR
ncbi:MAG: hypothetical protein JSW51_12325 [Gemmatimonadota bacterium]|nr:MAG: hypothetical protein JSW51_12325 [Gemmatimonadota bacterium]